MDNPANPIDYSLSMASLEIIILLLGAFILGALLCYLLRALGICCHSNTQEDEPSLFALQEPRINHQTLARTPRTNKPQETIFNTTNTPKAVPGLDIPEPELAYETPPTMPQAHQPPNMPDRPSIPDAVVPAVVREHRPEDELVRDQNVGSRSYIADINTLLRGSQSNDEMPTATRIAASRHVQGSPYSPPVEQLSLAELLSTPVDRVDNLRRLEGIGPRIEAILNEAGIKNYQRLAATQPSELRAILERGGEQFKNHDPKTWPYQAELASKGDWERLKEYQNYLLSGRN